jgi:LysM repeat protein
MRAANPLVAAVLAVLLSAALVAGGISLSMAEVLPQGTPSLPVPSANATPTEHIIVLLDTASPTSTQQPTTAVITPSATACPVPAGWQVYLTQPGDTIELLANVLKVRTDELREANCLPSGEPATSSYIFLPPQAAVSPPPTGTPPPCSQPAGWTEYIVGPGDNLSQIASSHNTTLADLRRVNCLGNSSLIQNGQSLFVPPIPMESPTPAILPTQSGTIQPTQAS